LAKEAFVEYFAGVRSREVNSVGQNFERFRNLVELMDEL
jgi:hypothetical protein